MWALVRGATGFPGAAVQVVATLDVVADSHPVNGRDPCCAGLPGPLPGLSDLGVLGRQPPSRFGDDGADENIQTERPCRAFCPLEGNRLQPRRGHAGPPPGTPQAGSVSMPTLHAWICDIDETSFSDSSRPDR